MNKAEWLAGWPEERQRLWAQMERYGVSPHEDMGDGIVRLWDGYSGGEYRLMESLEALEALDISAMDEEDREMAFWDALVPAE